LKERKRKEELYSGKKEKKGKRSKNYREEELEINRKPEKEGE